MSKGVSQNKARKNRDIRQYTVKDSERRVLRSSTMAGSNDSDDNTIQEYQKFYTDALEKLEERHNESQNKMEERLATQFTEIRTGIADNNSVITEVKSNLNKTDNSVDKIGTSMQNFSEEIRNLTVGQKKLEIDQAKIDIRLINLEERQTATESINEDLIKNIENHDREISALKAELAELKDVKREVEILKKENAQFKLDDESKEQHQRKYNLWFYGLEEPDSEAKCWDTIKNFCLNVLDLSADQVENINTKNSHRVGAPKAKKRPAIVVFGKWDDRQTVLRAAGQLYAFNQKNNTTFAVKTDLAPLARQKRKDYHGISNNMRSATKLLVRVCDNEKGKVWLESKKAVKDEWKKVNEKDIDPKWREKTPEKPTGGK